MCKTDLFRPLECINISQRPAHAVNAEDVTGHREEVRQGVNELCREKNGLRCMSSL